MASKKEDTFINYLENWFKKLPPLSREVRERLANIAPILALVFGILGVVIMGIFGLLSPIIIIFSGMHGVTDSLVSLVIGLVSSIMILVAYPSLKVRAFKGWRLLFWSQILSFVSAILHPFPSIVGLLVGIFGLYLLYQIKSLYK